MVELAIEATQDLHGGLVVFLHKEHRMTEGRGSPIQASAATGFRGLNFGPGGGSGQPGAQPGATSQKHTAVDLVSHPCLRISSHRLRPAAGQKPRYARGPH